MSKVRVGVIFGGVSTEHEVSLASGKNVLEAIDRSKYEVLEIGITKEGKWVIGDGALAYLVCKATEHLLPSSIGPVLEKYFSRYQIQPADGKRDLVKKLEVSLNIANSRLPEQKNLTCNVSDLEVVFPVLHGAIGEDGAIQGLFKVANIPVVGCGVLASSICMDKIATKMILDSAQIPQARWSWYPSYQVLDKIDQVELNINEKLGGFPVFIKPANQGSSVGVVKIHDRSELRSAIEFASKFDRRLLFEEAVVGRELEIAILGRYDLIVSPEVSEVIPLREFYDYQAKYIDDQTRIELPAKVSRSVVERMQELAKRAFRAVDGCGMARIDFFYQPDKDRVVLNEINTIPGFTNISQYPALIKTAGISYGELIDRLIQIALDRFEETKLITIC